MHCLEPGDLRSSDSTERRWRYDISLLNSQGETGSVLQRPNREDSKGKGIALAFFVEVLPVRELRV
jgi:hypothetical protein